MRIKIKSLDVVGFIGASVLMILTHEFMMSLYVQIFTTLMLLEIIHGALNHTLRRTLKDMLWLSFIVVVPFTLVAPYLLEFVNLYSIRIFSPDIKAALSSKEKPLNYGLSVLQGTISPYGWYGPLFTLLFCLLLYNIFKGVTSNVKFKKLSLLSLFNLIWILILAIFWLSPLLYMKVQDPIRALALMSFPAAYFCGKFLSGFSRSHKSFLSKCSDPRLFFSGAIVFILLFSSFQYSFGVFPNIFMTPQEPASIPTTGLTIEDYNAILWIQNNIHNGSVLADPSVGTWPAALTNLTSIVFWSKNEVSVWRKKPFWERRVQLNETDGFLTASSLSKLASTLKGEADLPFYLFVSRSFLDHSYPSTSILSLGQMPFLEKIYEAEGVFIYRFPPKKVPYANVTIIRDGMGFDSKVTFDYVLNGYALTLEKGHYYSVINFPDNLSFESVTPTPKVLNVDAHRYVNFTGDPSISYTILFTEMAPANSIGWKDDSFLNGWIYWDCNLTTNGHIMTLSKRTKTNGDHYGTTEKFFNVSLVGYTSLRIKYSFNGTSNAQIFLSIRDVQGNDLFLTTLRNPRTFQIDNFKLNDTISEKACSLRLIVLTNVPGNYKLSVDYILLTS
jgi:hypothetical protein